MHREPVTLREAVPDDAVFLAGLWEDVLRRASPAERVADAERLVARTSGSPTERVVVAELGAEPVGAVLLQETTVSPLDLEPAVQAHSPHVTSSARRRGVGTALLGAAVAFAEDRGIGRVMTASVTHSRESNRFLARLGLGQLATVRSAPTAVLRARVGLRSPRGRTAETVVAARRSMRRRTARLP